MAGQSLQTAGFILQKPPAADRFQRVLLFSAEHGSLQAFQRLSSRQPAAPLDFFDEVSATLNSTNQGRTWFFSELRILRRFAGIGLSFAALREASFFASLLTHNPIHDEGRAGVVALLGTALQAWNDGAQPEVVALKALYTFARAEGYPVKEDWAAGLRGRDLEAARQLLNQPLAAAKVTDADLTTRILESLRRYLRESTELQLEGK